MKLQDLSYLAIRVLAIYLFILGVNRMGSLLDFAVPSYLNAFEHEVSFWRVFLIVGIPAFVLLFGGLVLWMAAGKLSPYLVPKQARGFEISELSRDLEGIVLSIIGLILLLFSLTDAVATVLYLADMEQQGVRYGREGAIYELIGVLIKLVIGILLVVKASGIAALLAKVRNLGLRRSEEEERNES